MKNVFELVAAENGVSEPEMYQEIQDAIRTVMESDDSVKEKWKAMSKCCQTPSPEEAVCGILAMLITDKTKQ